MATKLKKPFNIKGKTIVSFLGESEWCKILPKQMETRFTPKGQYSVTVVGNPTAEDFIEFRNKVEAIIDIAYDEAINDEGALKIPSSKKKSIIKASPFKDHIIKEKDDNGDWTIETETGNITIRPKLKNVMDLPTGRNEVTLIGAGNTKIPLSTAPEIGNGSKIKAKMYVNPYYMPSTNTIGVSLNLQAIKIYELVEYGASSGEDFDDDGGFEVSGEDMAEADGIDF